MNEFNINLVGKEDNIKKDEIFTNFDFNYLPINNIPISYFPLKNQNLDHELENEDVVNSINLKTEDIDPDPNNNILKIESSTTQERKYQITKDIDVDLLLVGGGGGAFNDIVDYTYDTNPIKYTTNDTLIVPQDTVCKFVILGGGGGGAKIHGTGTGGGGGGGSGGMVYGTMYLKKNINYQITVGNGGVGATSHGDGTDGSNSSISGDNINIIAFGGGGGGIKTGRGGGSGGGASKYDTPSSSNLGGIATKGEINLLNNTAYNKLCFTSNITINGLSGTAITGGNGGGNSSNLSNLIFKGVLNTGATDTIALTNIVGSNGIGSTTATAAGAAGTSNLGCGGGGSSGANNGGNGSSGIVIIRAIDKIFSNVIIGTIEYKISSVTTIDINTASKIYQPGTTDKLCEVIIVGGGGGGGYGSTGKYGGGGAGGSIVYGRILFRANKTYYITIGNGGTGGTASSKSTNGGDTSIKGDDIYIIAYGGGGGDNGGISIGGKGGDMKSSYISLPELINNKINIINIKDLIPVFNITYLGFDGGSNNNQELNYGGSSGGGINSIGTSNITSVSVDGGSGLLNINDITLGTDQIGKGGSGGAASVSMTSSSIIVNTGNGGYGNNSSGSGGNGGSGVVFIKLANKITSKNSGCGGEVVYLNNYKIKKGIYKVKIGTGGNFGIHNSSNNIQPMDGKPTYLIKDSNNLLEARGGNKGINDMGRNILYRKGADGNMFRDNSELGKLINIEGSYKYYGNGGKNLLTYKNIDNKNTKYGQGGIGSSGNEIDSIGNNGVFILKYKKDDKKYIKKISTSSEVEPITVTSGIKEPLYDNPDYKLIYFRVNGTLTLTNYIECDVLLVGGGGGGGNHCYGYEGSGGGGGGSVGIGRLNLNPGSYTITIGEGGGGIQTNGNGNDGTDTTISYITYNTSNIAIAIAKGGGGGSAGKGNNGGSGGGSSGAGQNYIGGKTNKSPNTENIKYYGNNGGFGYNQSGGSGGGGAGTPGFSTGYFHNINGANGGNGILSKITGKDEYYGGGGGGSATFYDNQKGLGGLGGLGGGGNGNGNNNDAKNGEPNTGGGGGGANNKINDTYQESCKTNKKSGNGGSGIVIFRIKTSDFQKNYVDDNNLSKKIDTDMIIINDIKNEFRKKVKLFEDKDIPYNKFSIFPLVILIITFWIVIFLFLLKFVHHYFAYIYIYILLFIIIFLLLFGSLWFLYSNNDL
jgi:hypothetical protein